MHNELNHTTLLLSTGSSQADRLDIALNRTHIEPDERQLANQLSFLYNYAGLINFFSAKDHSQSWQALLKGDVSVLLSRIAIIEVDKIDSRFSSLQYEMDHNEDDDEDIELFREMLLEVYKLVELLDAWYKTAYEYGTVDEDSELGNLIRNSITYRLSIKYKTFVRLVGNYTTGEKALQTWQIRLSKLDKVWATPHEDLKKAQDKHLDDLSAAVKQLTFLFKDFLRTVTLVVDSAPKYLQASLHHNQHAPHNALILTFLKLYEHVQKDLNETTEKHLNYYFFDKLRQDFLPATPDRVFIYFTLSDHISSLILQKGTQLAAGIDNDGYEYQYQTDIDLEVTATEISDIKTAYVSKNQLIGVDNTYKLISGIYHAHIEKPEIGIGKVPFPAFGEDQISLSSNQRNMQLADIGFGITSPVLLMKEGKRTVILDFKVSLRSMSPMITFLEDYSRLENITAEAAFQKILAYAFNIRLSTPDGWYTLENYKIAPKGKWTDGIIHLTFEIERESSPITPLPPDHEDFNRFDSSWPIMEVILSTEKAMYAYSYLRDLEMEWCDIYVKVEGVKGLSVFNDLGKLDTSTAFYPFGTEPTLGAALLVGYDELFKKEITSLAFDLQWKNLPRQRGGLEEYYKQYKESISNQSFKISIQALSGYSFYPQTEQKTQVFSLFDTLKTPEGETESKRLAAHKTLEGINLNSLQIHPDYSMEELPDYDNSTRLGYLKLELVAPDFGFGHEMYPSLFAQEALEKSKFIGKEAFKLPNQPLAPQLKSLQLRYEAKSRLHFQDEKNRNNNRAAREAFYHFHPFGLRKTFEKSIARDAFLLPQFNSEGYLLIGLQKVQAPEVISLYFQLQQGATSSFGDEIPTVKWQYLVSNEWLNFQEEEVLYDGTNNFSTSGIIRLAVPSAITDDNTILPSSSYWLAASVEENADHLSYVQAIYTQAVEATWMPHRPAAEWQQPTPAGTIQRLMNSEPGIKEVFQPEASFGGRVRENKKKFNARISELLRHKNRAVTPWDYERLVLERFPIIDKVKCVTPQDSRGRLSGGEMVLVTIPAINRAKAFHHPCIDYNTLHDIKHYLERHSSSFTNIKVTNPVYEQVKINCKIRLVDNNKRGEYIKRIHEDLLRMICPWYYNASNPVYFGGYIRYEDVLNLLESREYISFLTRLSIVIIHNDRQVYTLTESINSPGGLYTSAPWSVLVPVDKHDISLLEKSIHESPEKAAIESMRLQDDFVIASAANKIDEPLPWKMEDDDNDDFYMLEVDL